MTALILDPVRRRAANERWQADLTHWQLADGTEIEILNIIDDHSRLAIASTVRRTTLAADVAATFVKACTRYGTPASVLTDKRRRLHRQAPWPR